MHRKKEIFLIPYSHLDTQWRWEFSTTINKYLKNTIDERMYLFDKYEGHHFYFTGILRYAIMRKYYLEDFDKVKTHCWSGLLDTILAWKTEKACSEL